jgi:hypothetical protein
VTCRLPGYPRFLDFLKADPRIRARGAYRCSCGRWHLIGAVDRIADLARRRGYGRFCNRVAA